MVIGYDINIPVAYRFLRRLARVSSVHTHNSLLAHQSSLSPSLSPSLPPSLSLSLYLHVSLSLSLSPQAASATMETHTMARYIAEHSLQDYQFVGMAPSLVGAASMYLALRMKKLGGWVSKNTAPQTVVFLSSLSSPNSSHLPLIFLSLPSHLPLTSLSLPSRLPFISLSPPSQLPSPIYMYL